MAFFIDRAGFPKVIKCEEELGRCARDSEFMVLFCVATDTECFGNSEPWPILQMGPECTT